MRGILGGFKMAVGEDINVNDKETKAMESSEQNQEEELPPLTLEGILWNGCFSFLMEWFYSRFNSTFYRNRLIFLES